MLARSLRVDTPVCVIEDVMVARCEEWVGSLVEFPGFVNDEGAPYRPTMVLWYEPETDCIIDSQLVRPEHGLMRAAGLFHLATREPKAGPPRRPRRVRVSDRALATALAGSLGDVEVVLSETPEIDEVIASMREHFRERGGDEASESRSYLTGGVDPVTMGIFFSAAATFYDAAPWEVIPPDEMLGVECKALGIQDGIAIVVGQLGQTFGVSIYFTRADADKMLALSEEAYTTGALPRDAALPDRHIMVSFDTRSELDRGELAEVEKYGWDVWNDSAYPRAALIEHDLASRTLTTEELVGVAAVLTAIAITAAESGDEVADAFEGGRPIRRPFAIGIGKGDEIDVDIVAPGGGPPREDPLRAEVFSIRSKAELQPALAIYSAALAGALNVELESDESNVLRGLVLIAAMTYGAPLLRLAPRKLTQLVVTEIPRHRMFSADDADAVFDLLRLAFDLGVRIFDDRQAHGCLRAVSPALRKRFAASLAAAGAKKRAAATRAPTSKTKAAKPAMAAKPTKSRR